jgi:hypothetical protein
MLAAAALVVCATAATSETVRIENGSDTFLAGAVVSETLGTRGDTFVAARSADMRGATQGDLHVSGFDVTVSADTAKDLFATGATVVVSGTVAEDLTAAGFSLRTQDSAAVQGNARLFGNTVTIEGPVAGVLSAMGRDVILNAPVAGDVRITAQTLSFGPDAVIGGTLTYSARDQIAVPERVAPAERVVFQAMTVPDAWREWDDMRAEIPVLPTVASLLFGFVVSLLFFLAVGALMLGFMPKRLEAMRQSVAQAPGRSVLLGILGLSCLFGMIPITALTIVGLPFVPIAILAIVVVWTLGYALGAYSVAMRVWVGFGGDAAPGNVARLLVFAGAITFIALLNFIPFVGWVANYTLVLLGIGAMTTALFQYLIGNPGAALDVDMKPLQDD